MISARLTIPADSLKIPSELATVGPEVRQQRVPHAAHGSGPGVQGGAGVHAQAHKRRAGVCKLIQRTVEVGGLVASAAGEGQGKGVQYNPLFTLELTERHLFARVASEGEIRSCGSDFDHWILPCVLWQSIHPKTLRADNLAKPLVPSRLFEAFGSSSRILRRGLRLLR